MTSAGGPAAQFEFDLARHSAAADIHPDHAEDFSRLSLVLSAGPKSQFLFVEYRSQLYRERLIQKLNEVLRSAGLRAAHFDISICANFLEAEESLQAFALTADAIHITGGDKWFTKDRWREMNLRRETVARDIAKRLILWLYPEQISELVESAPDVWAWRGGVYNLVEPDLPLAPSAAPQWSPAIDNRHLGERSRRMAALREQLKSSDIPDVSRAMLLDELAGLLFRLGNLDEALRIRHDEILPMFEKLGDVRSRALALGRMADIFEARGDLDEALRIRRDEQLPVFERLGDVYSRAVTQGKLGRGLMQKGDFAACRQMWQAAHADLERMRVPEAQTVQEWLDNLDRSLEKKE